MNGMCEEVVVLGMEWRGGGARVVDGEWGNVGLTNGDAISGVVGMAEEARVPLVGIGTAAGVKLYPGTGREEAWFGGGRWYEYRRGLGLSDAEETAGFESMWERVML